MKFKQLLAEIHPKSRFIMHDRGEDFLFSPYFPSEKHHAPVERCNIKMKRTGAKLTFKNGMYDPFQSRSLNVRGQRQKGHRDFRRQNTGTSFFVSFHHFAQGVRVLERMRGEDSTLVTTGPFRVWARKQRIPEGKRFALISRSHPRMVRH